MKATDQKILQAVVSGGLTDHQRKAILEILTNGAVNREPQPLLLTQTQKARQLGVSHFTVRKLTKAGKLRPVELLPGLVRYRAEELI